MSRRRYAFRRDYRIERPVDRRERWQQGYGENLPAPSIVFGRDTLTEVTAKELDADSRQHGPRLSKLVPVDYRRAHEWVKDGGHHETGLYTDSDGRIRYAEDGI